MLENISALFFAFVAGIVFTWLLISILERFSLKQNVREDGPESHLKKSKTLTMGGIAIFFAVITTILVFGDFSNPRIRVVIFVASVCFFIGLLDDLKKVLSKNTTGIKARYKLVFEILLGIFLFIFIKDYMPTASLVPAGLIWSPWWFKDTIQLTHYLLLILVICTFVGTLNSINFTDGLDGLLSGSYIITASAFLIFVNNKTGDKALSTILVALIGASLAFLWFNSHPARIFMGDTGSLFLGAMLGAIAILMRAEFFLLLVGGLYVTEMLSVIIQVIYFRLTNGKRIFKMTPIHHHFELSGWAESKVAINFWIVSFWFAAVGLLLFL